MSVSRVLPTHCTSLLLLLLGGLPFPVLAQPAVIVSCDFLLREKLYPKAFRCFMDKAKQTLQHKKTMSKLRRIQIGIQIQQAAGAAEQIARQSNTIEKKAYWWEQAVQVMRLSYRQKLCVRTYRCRQLLGKIAELQQKIGYGRLTVRLPAKIKVRVYLRGYQLKRHSDLIQERWTAKRLRPGPYILVVKTDTGQSRRCRTFLKRGQEQHVRCSPNLSQLSHRKHRAKPIPLPQHPGSGLATTGWIVVGVGAVVVLTGSVLLGLGQDALTQRDERSDKLREMGRSATANALQSLAQKASTQLIPEIEALDQSGRTQILAGWFMAGLGVTTLGIGFALTMINRPSPSTTPSPQSQPNHSRSLIIIETEPSHP